ncbi:expansin-like A2 [Dioscorea cayenensis subsp. rotundata]|uniref:Expansin-like A2 n=1 Tax=Dioscorea cayennensis subsp. rotundata TaxID=55577 RepID=A0AB40CFC1_DIOCR|nr:expansin-like A2 [Dioscorea cayenensis subsp. rotundata]
MNFSIFFFLIISFIVFSSTTACDRCVHKSKVSYFPSSSSLSAGACGYGSMAMSFNGGYVAASNPSLYRHGVGCGACFQIRCKNKMCSTSGVKVILTDMSKSNTTSFVLAKPAFEALAKPGMASEMKNFSILDVAYKRIPCAYKRNLSVIVEESSEKPSNLVIKFLFQGGQTDIVAVDVAQVGSSDWRYMTQSYNGPVWNTNRAPAGPLQMRMVVTGGYDGKWIWADKQVIPIEWKIGSVYDLGVQISDIAQEGCSPCDTDEWK